jgi:alanyl-tRNA synthetase
LTGARSVYETELFAPLLEVLRAQQTIQHPDGERMMRIVADHMRAAAFIIVDGVEPSNKDRGYVLRRLMRRSLVYARQLGMHTGWHRSLTDVIISGMGIAYPELNENDETIHQVIAAEKATHLIIIHTHVRIQNMHDRIDRRLHRCHVNKR